jgi:CheY-like chemotaxis protein
VSGVLGKGKSFRPFRAESEAGRGDAMAAEIAKFLIVDDDVIAVTALERSIRTLGLANPVRVARDGKEALDVLQGTSADPLAPPFILLVDLDMPRMNGLELLDAIRADPKLDRTVAFMLSSSDDIAAAYDRHVAGYLLKGASPRDSRPALEMLGDFCNAVVLPT